jgi:hypothetical protein
MHTQIFSRPPSFLLSLPPSLTHRHTQDSMCINAHTTHCDTRGIYIPTHSALHFTYVLCIISLHTYTHTLSSSLLPSLTHSATYTHTLFIPPSLSHTQCNIHTHSLHPSFPLSHTVQHTHTHSLFIPPSLSHTQCNISYLCSLYDRYRPRHDRLPGLRGRVQSTPMHARYKRHRTYV